MTKTNNNIEEYIMKLLHRVHIYHPHQLNMEQLSQRLGIPINYLHFESSCIDGHIFIDNRKSDIQQWQDFGHELCHSLWHAGNQALLPISMTEYQEWRANSFAFNLCVPSYMLERMDLPKYEKEAVWLIMETFGVDQEFAAKRLEQYVRNLYSRMS